MATQADLDALEAALAQGEMRVRFADGREVQYRTVAELRSALAALSPRVSSVPFNRTTLTGFARD